MTDRTILTADAEMHLIVAPDRAGLRLSLVPTSEAPAHISVPVTTSRLLAAIDAADPDAMRAYLRETVEHAYLENMGVPATEPEIPEADSPEDVDELPDRDETTEAAQIDRWWALDKAADALGRLSAVGSPAGALPLLDVAGWIIDGTVNTPGEVIS